jgi:hypothetical protein
MKTDFTFELPQRVKEMDMISSFYVRMNQHYVATVRSLEGFIWAINNCGIDENFGEITKLADKEAEGYREFHSYLIEIIAEVKGFAVFNREFPHQFIQCENANETISIRTKKGKRITISVIEMADCADIAFHDSTLEPISNGNKDIPQFEMIGFNCGSTPIQRTPITIATIMLK